MAAASSDKFSKTSAGDIAAVATVTAPRASGVTALSVDTQLNWPTDTGIKFSTFKVDPSKLDAYGNPTKILGSQTDWKGVSNGSNGISNLIRTGGATDTGNAVGDKVVMIITSQWGEDIVEGLLTSHDQTGGLLPASVAAATANNSITTSKLADDSVTDAKLQYGKVRNRQGGDPISWSISGTTNYPTDSSNTFVQVGISPVPPGGIGTVAVTFPTAFTQSPNVICSPTNSGGSTPSWYIESVTSTGFNFRANQNVLSFFWQAVGN